MWSRPTARDVVLSYRSYDIFSESLAQSVQKVWSLKCLPATAVAGAAVKSPNFAIKLAVCSESNSCFLIAVAIFVKHATDLLYFTT